MKIWTLVKTYSSECDITVFTDKDKAQEAWIKNLDESVESDLLTANEADQAIEDCIVHDDCGGSAFLFQNEIDIE